MSIRLRPRAPYPPTWRSWVGSGGCLALAALMTWYAFTPDGDPAGLIMAALFVVFALAAWEEGKT